MQTQVIEKLIKSEDSGKKIITTFKKMKLIK